ncbi:Rv1733c family protein [Streptomyces fungicidicus]|uniref:Rv1733c family protein n=1 Tax=Streptomyces fungicidicus TaxID=68203 RepID=UPI00368D11C2
MARTRGARPRRVRLWRWRRNPLRRRSDLAEAWLLLGALVLALLLGVLSGLAAAGAVDGSLAERRERSSPVAAVLTEDAAGATASVTENGDGGVWAKVRWTAPDGTLHTGRAEVSPRSPAGTEVTVWTDPAGRLVAAPPEGAEARFQTVMAGVTVAVATGGLVLLGGRLGRRRLELRRLDAWEAEWRRVEPSWRRRMTG